MAFTLFQAAQTAQNPLARGIFRSIVTEDWLFLTLPFVSKSGDSFSYARECVLPSTEWIAPGAQTTESAGYDQTVLVPKREISSDFDVDRFVVANMSDTSANDPLARAIARKAKSAGRLLSQAVIAGNYATTVSVGGGGAMATAIDAAVAGPGLDTTRQGPGELKYTNTGTLWQFRAPGDVDFGEAVAVAGDATVTLYSQNKSKYITLTIDVSDIIADALERVTISSTTNEPDGLNNLISPAQTRASAGTNGDPVSFDILDELLDMVKVRNNLAFVMNAGVRREIKALLRAQGGNTAETIMMSGFNSNTGEIENVPILAYDGVPLLKNDWIPATESKGANTDLSSVYLVDMSGEEGFYVGAFGGSSMNLDVDPRSRPALGFELVTVGPVQDRNRDRYRINFYGGFALGSDLAAARATQIMSPNSTPNP